VKTINLLGIGNEVWQNMKLKGVLTQKPPFHTPLAVITYN